MDTPLVSICCLVYNHEPFLRECFEGFVMQKTTFPIEVLVHDDASTDHSADIIREYTEKYPDIFKPYYQRENQYSQGKGFIGININFERAQGKYIAMCEGDDYWTDPLKLQKQVDFLESHVNYFLCFHPVRIYDLLEHKMKEDHITSKVAETTSIRDLAKGNYIQTVSVLFRVDKKILSDFSNLVGLKVSDYPLWMLLAQKGLIYRLDHVMAVYRWGSGIWSTTDEFNRRIAGLVMLSKLISYIDVLEIRDELEKQISINEKYLLNLYKLICDSKSYKVALAFCRIKHAICFGAKK